MTAEPEVDEDVALVIAVFMDAYDCTFDEARAALTSDKARIALDVRRRRAELRARFPHRLVGR